MSKRQISKIYPGTTFINREFKELGDRLIEKHGKCIACGSRKNLEPHHIIPCHSHDPLFVDEENLCVICRPCHDAYHQNYFPINSETFREFKRNPVSKTRKRKSKKGKREFKRKKYERSPNYTKIRINDFRQGKTKRHKLKARKKQKRLNPIFLSKNLGCDDWDFIEKLKLEREVLGDYYEKRGYH